MDPDHSRIRRKPKSYDQSQMTGSSFQANRWTPTRQSKSASRRFLDMYKLNSTRHNSQLLQLRNACEKAKGQSLGSQLVGVEAPGLSDVTVGVRKSTKLRGFAHHVCAQKEITIHTFFRVVGRSSPGATHLVPSCCNGPYMPAINGTSCTIIIVGLFHLAKHICGANIPINTSPVWRDI